ncbi:hypothetical protein VNO80_13305 [Phaseolus coccineus]|uniref:Uncharacterized protein n=1 Tax=Phaseolus coccineus TaxID=3886 RepID=A0AAN9N777_PHACN
MKDLRVPHTLFCALLIESCLSHSYFLSLPLLCTLHPSPIFPQIVRTKRTQIRDPVVRACGWCLCDVMTVGRCFHRRLMIGVVRVAFLFLLTPLDANQVVILEPCFGVCGFRMWGLLGMRSRGCVNQSWGVEQVKV